MTFKKNEFENSRKYFHKYEFKKKFFLNVKYFITMNLKKNFLNVLQNCLQQKLESKIVNRFLTTQFFLVHSFKLKKSFPKNNFRSSPIYLQKIDKIKFSHLSKVSV